MKRKLNLEVSLLEIILSIIIFAICCVVVVNCFIIARYTQIKANDKTIGIMKVQTILEYIKSSINIDEMNQYLTSEFDEINNNIYVNYYDKNWNNCGNSEKEYIVKVKLERNQIRSGEIISISVSSEKVKPYPFTDNKGENYPIILLSTNKWFSNLDFGGNDGERF